MIGLRTFAAMMLSATALPVVLTPLSPAIDRLAGMPLQTRLELSKSLERFEQLPTAEQQAIRELDRELSKLDPEERKRYLDLMRRFGAWFHRLDEETRLAFQSASSEDRFVILRQELGPDSAPESPGLDMAVWFRADTFNPVPLYDAVTLMRVWALLDDAARRQVEVARSLDETITLLRQFARDRQIEPSPEVREAFRAILEDQGRLGQRGVRLLPEVPDLGAWLLDGEDPSENRPFGGGPGNFPRRPPGPSGPQAEGMRINAARLSAARLSLLRIAEMEYLRVLRDQADGAALAVLPLFEARLPQWYRDLLDPLPPEVVRLRLRALRQLALNDPDLMRWLEQITPVSAPGADGTASPSEDRPSLVRPF